MCLIFHVRYLCQRIIITIILLANTWQSNQARQNNSQSYGLTHVDIYQPDASTHTFTAPEGFDITVHSNTDLVPEK